MSGRSNSYEVEKKWFGTVRQFPQNDSGIKSLQFLRTGSNLIRVNMEYKGREVILEAGYGTWVTKKLELDDKLLQDHGFAYAWTAEDILVIKHYLMNTAYVKEYTFKFGRQKVCCKVSQNVAIPGTEREVEFESL